MVPIYPVTVIVVELPVHKVAAVAVAVPPTETGFMVTVVVVELAAEQTPLVNTAR